MTLPPPYTRALSADDITRYQDALPAREAEALHLRRTGRRYSEIGRRFDVSATHAFRLVQNACRLLDAAKRWPPPPPLREDTP